MRRRASANRQHGLSLEDVHRPLGALETKYPTFADLVVEARRVGSGPGTAIKSDEGLSTIGAVSSGGSSPFHDAMHKYSVFVRPKSTEDVRDLADLVWRSAALCGTGADRWKVFLLLSFLRRYHAKAPSAREETKDTPEGEEEDGPKKERHDGDGERLIFYVTCLALRRLWRFLGSGRSSSETAPFRDTVRAAIGCMIDVAPGVGGTRDVNAMAEHLCFESLVDRGDLSVAAPEKLGSADDFKAKLVSAIRGLDGNSEEKDEAMDKVLDAAASLLDADLKKCGEQRKKRALVPRDELMSTIHVMLPHRDRGNREGKAWQRNLVNCVLEVLIWKRTAVGREEDRFRKAAVEFRNAAGGQDGAYDCVLRMQTSARKKRKLLNDLARTQGSLLSSQFLVDRSALTMRQVKRAKAGDLAMLQNLASKSRDSRVLSMIMNRSTDPTKANSIESLGSLISGWHDTTKMVEEESIEDLELKIQAQTVRTTLERLRAQVGKNEDGRSVLVATLGRGVKDAVCAILVAAALYPHSRLLLGNKEADLSSDELVLGLLNSAILGDEGVPEPKSVESILEEDMGETQDLILLSQSDVQLDGAALEELQQQGKTIRVHATSRVDIAEPVEVELKTEIHEKLKAGSPVSVTVLLDCTGSMGSEINGCKKGALKAIDTFNDLSPVRWANFIGYWDPIGSRGDPDPRSTGYLDPRKEGNLEKIQTFVDTQLPCTGGGDEPEDVPAALEKLMDDMEVANLSADNGVHFVFFVADAGYRSNENERVTTLLTKASKLGVVMVMCPVRSYSYGTIATLVTKNKEVFQPGQYIKLGGVSQLSSIVSTVTESIRASLFDSGNVSSVTASVGETMEALSQLCKFQKDHASLKKIEELSKPPPETTMAEEEEDSKAEEPMDEKEEIEEENSSKGDDAMEDKEDEPKEANEHKPVFLSENTFSVTNLDRLYLQISRLPGICHQHVEDAFGGKTLQEVVAADIAKRMVDEGISIISLRTSGYPSDLVELVRDMMGGHGGKRVV